MAGDIQKCAATLRAILQESHDPGAVNDSANILADAMLELPLAEASTRSAINQLTEESNSWTFDENPQTLHDKSRLIVAAWDTLGWTLFREGKPEQAQPYLQAAWIELPNIDTGKHLGDLYAASGNKSASLTAYELAIATEPGYNALGVRTEPSDKQKRLQESVDELRRGGAKSTAPIPGNKLLALRTIPLDAAKGRSGQAEYRLLLKDGKASKTEPTGDKSVPGATDMIANANFTSFFPGGISSCCCSHRIRQLPRQGLRTHPRTPQVEARISQTARETPFAVQYGRGVNCRMRRVGIYIPM
jgi:tetratricopeptide (TPR) repeat protein